MSQGIKISQLTGGGSALEGDTIPIARGGNTFKLTVGDIAGSLTAASNSIKGNPTLSLAKAVDIVLSPHSILARTSSTIENLIAETNTVLCRLDANSTLAFRSFTGDLIQNNTISNTKLSQAPAYTIKLNNTGNTANVGDFAIADNSVLVRSGNFTSLVAGNNTILRRLGGTSTLEFGQVTTDLIDNNAITSDKLNIGSVTNNAITDNTISGNKLVANSVNLDRIQQITGQSVLGNVGTGLGNIGAVKVTPGLLSTGGPSWNTLGDLTPSSGKLIGNADTATSLQTARNITVGGTSRSFDGSSNISWTLDNIIQGQADILAFNNGGFGTVTTRTDGTYKYYIFKVNDSISDFTWIQAGFLVITNCISIPVELFLVGGGGGGGSRLYAGGGGGGDARFFYGVLGANTYVANVGCGGFGGGRRFSNPTTIEYMPGENGGPTEFAGYTVLGGGGGGSSNDNVTAMNGTPSMGRPGGSAGGASGYAPYFLPSSIGFGTRGGRGGLYGGGGGGGALSPGDSGTNSVGGRGGEGNTSNRETGSDLVYGSGGGGGGYSNSGGNNNWGLGGTRAGRGGGNNQAPLNGVNSSGGGGGGANNLGPGGTGGHGIIVVRINNIHIKSSNI